MGLKLFLEGLLSRPADLVTPRVLKPRRITTQSDTEAAALEQREPERQRTQAAPENHTYTPKNPDEGLSSQSITCESCLSIEFPDMELLPGARFCPARLGPVSSGI